MISTLPDANVFFAPKTADPTPSLRQMGPPRDRSPAEAALLTCLMVWCTGALEPFVVLGSQGGRRGVEHNPGGLDSFPFSFAVSGCVVELNPFMES